MALAAERYPQLRVVEHRPKENNIIPFPIYEAADPVAKARLEIIEFLTQIRLEFGIPPSFQETLNQIIDALSPVFEMKQESNLQVKIYNFNPLDNRTRFLELQSKLNSLSTIQEITQVQEQKRSMLWGNFFSYLKEYVLFEPYSEYTYKSSEFDDDQQTMEGFEFTGLIDLCQKTVDTYRERGLKMTRLNIENIIYGPVLHRIVRLLPVGTEFCIDSPPGSKNSGYIGKDSYSFFNLFKIILDQTGKKTVVLHQYARWVSLDEHVRFIEKFGGFFDKGLALNDTNVILHPFFPKNEYTEKDIAKYLEQFTSRVPESKKERQVNKKEFEVQARLIFNHFYFPLIDQLIQQPLNQELVEKMELALSFAQRKLMDYIDQDELFQQQKSKIPARSITMEDIKGKKGLEELYWNHSAVTIDKSLKFASKQAKENHIQGLSSHFGRNINKIIGAGSCYGSEMARLAQGLQAVTNKFQTQTEIAKIVGHSEAQTWHHGSCITCGKEGMVGPCEICPSCDNRFPNSSVSYDDLSAPYTSADTQRTVESSSSENISPFPFTLLPGGRPSISANELFLRKSSSVNINYIINSRAA